MFDFLQNIFTEGQKSTSAFPLDRQSEVLSVEEREIERQTLTTQKKLPLEGQKFKVPFLWRSKTLNYLSSEGQKPKSAFPWKVKNGFLTRSNLTFREKAKKTLRRSKKYWKFDLPRSPHQVTLSVHWCVVWSNRLSHSCVLSIFVSFLLPNTTPATLPCKRPCFRFFLHPLSILLSRLRLAPFSFSRLKEMHNSESTWERGECVESA